MLLTLLRTSNELRRYVTMETDQVPGPVHREEERLRHALVLPVLGAQLLHWLDAQYKAGIRRPMARWPPSCYGWCRPHWLA